MKLEDWEIEEMMESCCDLEDKLKFLFDINDENDPKNEEEENV